MLLIIQKAKEYGFAKLANDLDLCELSLKNKIYGRSKMYKSEIIAIGVLLNLSPEELIIVKKEIEENNGNL